MHKLRGNVIQGHKHKGTLVQPRVRDDEVGLFEDEVVIEQDVHVDQARAVAEGLFAAQVGLELFQKGNQSQRFAFGLACECHVEEGRLVSVAPRWSLVDGRERRHADSRR